MWYMIYQIQETLVTFLTNLLQSSDVGLTVHFKGLHQSGKVSH